jgi:hypothetical protein
MIDEADSNEPWNETLALDLPGKLLLVGLTFTDSRGTPKDQQQFWERVVTADRRDGIQLLLKGARSGETFFLPPDTRSINRASPGDYRLRSTGEVVTDPDYTVTFLVQKNDG